MENDPTAALAASLDEIIRYVQRGEKIVAAAGQLARLAEDLAEIPTDGDLSPEIGAALGHLTEAGAAIARALATSNTLTQVRLSRISNEGGPSDE